MTLIVGLNLGDYALLGADTRVVCKYPDGSTENDDEAAKICKFSLGIIAGAGLESLVQSAVALTTGADITHVDQLLDIIEQERKRALDAEPDADVKIGIEHTGWMFTYLAAQNGDKPQLAATTQLMNPRWEAIPLNESWLLPPAGATVDQIREWLAFLKANLKPMDNSQDIESNVNYHRDVVGQLMRKVSEVNPTVAASFQIAVHSAPNRVGISPVFRCREG
jgi:hypothetical protein